MTKATLITALQALGVKPSAYALDGSLDPDSIVLYQNYSIWEVFYHDERGGRNDVRMHPSEADACTDILNRFKRTHRAK